MTRVTLLWGGQMAMRENSATHWSAGGGKGVPIQTTMKALQPGVSPGEDLPLVKLGQTAAAGASAPAGRSD